MTGNTVDQLDDKSGSASETKTDTPVDAQANADFESGFKAVAREPVIGEQPIATESPPDTTTDADNQAQDTPAAAAAAVTPAEPAPDKVIDKRLRKLEGNFGNVNRQLSEISGLLKDLKEKPVGTGDAAHTEQAAQATLKHLSDIEQVIGQFSEFAPIKDELIAIRQDMQAIAQRGETGKTDGAVQDLGRLTESISDIVTLNVRFPAWKDTVQRPEFKSFVLEGGPAPADYDNYRRLKANPDTLAQAQEMLDEWKDDFKPWFENRGQYLFSDSVSANLVVFDQFDQAERAKAGRNQQQTRDNNRNQRRLAANIEVGSSGASTVMGKTDPEAFESGFNGVMRNRLGPRPAGQ